MARKDRIKDVTIAVLSGMNSDQTAEAAQDEMPILRNLDIRAQGQGPERSAQTPVGYELLNFAPMSLVPNGGATGANAGSWSVMVYQFPNQEGNLIATVKNGDGTAGSKSTQVGQQVNVMSAYQETWDKPPVSIISRDTTEATPTVPLLTGLAIQVTDIATFDTETSDWVAQAPPNESDGEMKFAGYLPVGDCITNPDSEGHQYMYGQLGATLNMLREDGVIGGTTDGFYLCLGNYAAQGMYGEQETLTLDRLVSWSGVEGENEVLIGTINPNGTNVRINSMTWAADGDIVIVGRYDASPWTLRIQKLGTDGTLRYAGWQNLVWSDVASVDPGINSLFRAEALTGAKLGPSGKIYFAAMWDATVGTPTIRQSVFTCDLGETGPENVTELFNLIALLPDAADYQNVTCMNFALRENGDVLLVVGISTRDGENPVNASMRLFLYTAATTTAAEVSLPAGASFSDAYPGTVYTVPFICSTETGYLVGCTAVVESVAYPAVFEVSEAGVASPIIVNQLTYPDGTPNMATTGFTSSNIDSTGYWTRRILLPQVTA